MIESYIQIFIMLVFICIFWRNAKKEKDIIRLFFKNFKTNFKYLVFRLSWIKWLGLWNLFLISIFWVIIFFFLAKLFLSFILNHQCWYRWCQRYYFVIILFLLWSLVFTYIGIACYLWLRKNTPFIRKCLHDLLHQQWYKYIIEQNIILWTKSKKYYFISKTTIYVTLGSLTIYEEEWVKKTIGIGDQYEVAAKQSFYLQGEEQWSVYIMWHN